MVRLVPSRPLWRHRNGNKSHNRQFICYEVTWCGLSRSLSSWHIYMEPFKVTSQCSLFFLLFVWYPTAFACSRPSGKTRTSVKNTFTWKCIYITYMFLHHEKNTIYNVRICDKMLRIFSLPVAALKYKIFDVAGRNCEVQWRSDITKIPMKPWKKNKRMVFR